MQHREMMELAHRCTVADYGEPPIVGNPGTTGGWVGLVVFVVLEVFTTLAEISGGRLHLLTAGIAVVAGLVVFGCLYERVWRWEQHFRETLARLRAE